MALEDSLKVEETEVSFITPYELPQWLAGIFEQ